MNIKYPCIRDQTNSCVANGNEVKHAIVPYYASCLSLNWLLVGSDWHFHLKCQLRRWNKYIIRSIDVDIDISGRLLYTTSSMLNCMQMRQTSTNTVLCKRPISKVKQKKNVFVSHNGQAKLVMYFNWNCQPSTYIFTPDKCT